VEEEAAHNIAAARRNTAEAVRMAAVRMAAAPAASRGVAPNLNQDWD